MRSERLDFSERANLTEWMDEPCTYPDFRDCLKDLESANKLLLAYRPTLQWLKQFADKSVGPLHIVDVGCGGGDMLRRIGTWARQRGLAVKLTGIDLNPYAARAAQESGPEESAIEWITGDAYSYRPAVPIDIVLSSLFTHHLSDVEIVDFLRWMERVAVLGWFINDLHRMRIFYHAFRALAAMMHWHSFVRHDGPISIRRSFVCSDWERYCGTAAIDPQAIHIRARQPGHLCMGRVKP